MYLSECVCEVDRLRTRVLGGPHLLPRELEREQIGTKSSHDRSAASQSVVALEKPYKVISDRGSLFNG